MRKLLVMIALLLPVLLLQAQSKKQPSHAPKKIHLKEISVSKLPKPVTGYISANLPNAKVVKAMKQKRSPEARYIVSIKIKTRYHTLFFNKGGELVKLDGKKIKTAKDQKK